MLALIGDIHGCLRPLEEIVNAALQRTSILVFLGDYVNRGPDSAKVVEFLVSLQGEKQIETHFLEGNHDVEFRKVLDGGEVDHLLRMGGASTIAAYVEHPYGDVGEQLRRAVPSSHYEFFNNLELSFAIAGLTASHENPSLLSPGQYSVSGHAPRSGLVPMIGESTAFIDTGCGTIRGGRLTCLYWPNLEWTQSTTTWSAD